MEISEKDIDKTMSLMLDLFMMNDIQAAVAVSAMANLIFGGFKRSGDKEGFIGLLDDLKNSWDEEDE